MGCGELCFIELGCIEWQCIELGCIELRCTELHCIELCCIELRCTGLQCIAELLCTVPYSTWPCVAEVVTRNELLVTWAALCCVSDCWLWWNEGPCCVWPGVAEVILVEAIWAEAQPPEHNEP